jgi:hypothetical protein
LEIDLGNRQNGAVFLRKNKLIQGIDYLVGFVCNREIRARFRADGIGQRKKIMRCRFFSGALAVSAKRSIGTSFQVVACARCLNLESSPCRKSFLAAQCPKRVGVSVGSRAAGIRQREWDGFVLSFMRSFMLRFFCGNRLFAAGRAQEQGGAGDGNR